MPDSQFTTRPLQEAQDSGQIQDQTQPQSQFNTRPLITPEQQLLNQINATPATNWDIFRDKTLGAIKSGASGVLTGMNPENWAKPLYNPPGFIQDIQDARKQVLQQAQQEKDPALKQSRETLSKVPILGPGINSLYDALNEAKQGNFDTLANFAGQMYGAKLGPEAELGLASKTIPSVMGKTIRALTADEYANLVRTQGYQKALDIINKYKSPNYQSDVFQMLQDTTSVKSWLKSGMKPQDMENLALRKLMTDHTDFGEQRLNASDARNSLNQNPVYATAISPQVFTNTNNFLAELNKNQNVVNKPFLSNFHFYRGGMGLTLPGVGYIGGHFLGHGFEGLAAGAGAILTLKGLEYGLGKLMSNPSTSNIMMKLANPKTPVTGALTKPILNSLKGVSGLSIVTQAGKEIPVEVNDEGQLVPK